MIKEILINGFGRIGRAIFRLLWESDSDTLCCSAIVEPNISIKNLIYLLKYDTIYGKFDGEIRLLTERLIQIKDNRKTWNVAISNSSNYINYVDNSISPFIIIDSSGMDNSCEVARTAVDKGVKYVLITNWQKDADYILTYGYNHLDFNPRIHQVISTGICDSAAILPTIHHVEQFVNIMSIHIITLHPWLSYQNLLDAQTNHNTNDLDFRIGQ